MKKFSYIVILIVVTLFFWGCGRLSNKLDNIKLLDDKYLCIEQGELKYYVSSEKVGQKFHHEKKLGFLEKDIESSKIYILDYLYLKEGVTGEIIVIEGYDLKKELIELNDTTFKLTKSKDNLLDINTIFPSNHLTFKLNPNNLNEFIDNHNQRYVLGEEVKEKELTGFVGNVHLNGEVIYSISYDEDTQEILTIKEKSFMGISNEHKNICDMNFEFIYRMGENEYAVQVNNKYYKLTEVDVKE